ncbi:MAG: alpha-N-arabinofuranosidase, partial [Vicinamibacteria bacterium]
RAEPPAVQARIQIDLDRTVGEIHPRLFGNFAEHLGRVIYGGIYDEGSPLADSDGFRRDVMEATRGLGVSILRWPGGNFASGYHWKDGIGPKDRRPVRPDHAWGALETNRFGTDEFLRYCEKLGVEPYISINAGLGTVDEAREWVEYCNEPRKTYWAEERRKNGREKPWNVRVWGLGNEIDGVWQLGHKNVEDYVKFAVEAGKAMRRADQSIELVASGSSNFSPNADWIGWNRAVLQGLKDQIDYISLHTYVGNRSNNFGEFLAESQDLDTRIETVRGLIRAAQLGQPKPRPIAIAFDEWNVWYRAWADGGEYALGRTGLEERYNFEDALAMGMFLNSFIRHADVVKMANLAQLVNAIAPIFTNNEGLFLQPIYFPIAEYGRQRGSQALDLRVTSPTHAVAGRGAVSDLDVSASYDAKGRIVYANVLNRSETLDLTTEIGAGATRLGRTVEVWEMSHPDLKATHTFGDDKRVRPVVRTTTVTVTDKGLSYTFPRHSLTILRLKLE